MVSVFFSFSFWVWSGLVQVEDLQSVFLLELKILLVEGVDSINHGLDKLNLGVSETVLVGNIISSTWKEQLMFRTEQHHIHGLQLKQLL